MMYSHHYGFIDMVIHAVVNGLIYGAFFKLFHRLTLAEAALVTIVGICVVGYAWYGLRVLRQQK